MISAVLFFFGATLIYTGFLASGRDLVTGLAVAFFGLIVVIKPALEALKYCRTHFRANPRPDEPQRKQERKVRKIHLKVVKSEDDKPTIH
jgi:hypothetical protein